MDNNKIENLIGNKDKNKNELKEIYDDNSNEEEIPKEVQMYYNKPTNGDNLEEKKKDLISETESEAGQPIGKKEMEIILLSLNPYWIELIACIGFATTLIIYEVLGIMGLTSIVALFTNQLTTEFIMEVVDIIINKLGLKWLFFTTLNTHLSVGFFCLTTFSNMLTEIKNVKKFLIVNFIKVALFYTFSVIVLKVLIKDKFGGYLHKKIDETKNEDKEAIYKIFDRLIDKILLIVANFLSTFNTFLDKFILGIMYIFLFKEPNLSGKKLIIFRFLTLIPIIYIIVSLVLRAIDNYTSFNLNIFISPILLGPKVVIYLFFISTLLVIKYKSIKYNVFDSEDDISPKVFSNIGGKTFGFFGVLELIIGLFWPSWSPSGIGGKYLLVICAPIMTLYDYKRKSPMKFPFCKKGNFSLFIKIIVNFILYFIIVILGIYLLAIVEALFELILKDLWEFIIKNIDTIGQILNLILGPNKESE